MSTTGDRLRDFFDRFDMLSRTDPGLAAKEANEALSLARRSRNRESLANAYLNRGAIDVQLGRFDMAREHLEKAEQIFSEIGNHVSLAKVYYRQSLLLRDTGKYAESLGLLLDADELVPRHGHESQRGIILNTQGVIYQHLDDNGMALERFGMALQIFTSEGDIYWQGVVHQNIGALHANAGNLDEGYSHLIRSRELESDLKAPRTKAIIDINIGVNLRQRGNLVEARKCYESALESARHLKDQELITVCLLYLGITYGLSGEYETSLAYLSSALEVSSHADIQPFRPRILYNISCSLRQSGRMVESRTYLIAALEIVAASTAVDSTDVNDILSDIHNALSCSYEDDGELEPALRHARLYEEARSKSSAQTAALMLARADMRLKVERIEREKEAIRLANEHLRLELELKERELVTLAIHLAQKSTLLERLKQTTTSADLHDTEGAHKAIALLAEELEREAGTEEIWERFERQFRQIHPEFVSRLCQRFPALSPAELRLCALLRLDLSTKEMAALLSLSTRSIEVYRSRVRGKLGLDSGQSLAGFLCGV